MSLHLSIIIDAVLQVSFQELPFNHIEDDNEFDIAIHSPVKQSNLLYTEPLANRSEELASTTGSCDYCNI